MGFASRRHKAAFVRRPRLGGFKMSSFKRLFVLGAADPEMQEIESLLRKAGEEYCFAIFFENGKKKRVYPGNAYKMDWFDRDINLPNLRQIIFVECGSNTAFERDVNGDIVLESQGGEYLGRLPVTVIDHHRPGDPGYGKLPEDYLQGSSLGQILSLLGLEPSEEQRMIAAADHCLEAAYRGKCPGVDSRRLMLWRARSRAAFQKRDLESVFRDIEDAKMKLLRATQKVCPRCGSLGCTGGCGCGIVTNWCDYQFADLRGYEDIPELPEAAAQLGIPFMSVVTDKDGRRKIVLMSAPPELVESFLRGELTQGLSNFYGDPARGFAGGYLR